MSQRVLRRAWRNEFCLTNIHHQTPPHLVSDFCFCQQTLLCPRRVPPTLETAGASGDGSGETVSGDVPSLKLPLIRMERESCVHLCTVVGSLSSSPRDRAEKCQRPASTHLCTEQANCGVDGFPVSLFICCQHFCLLLQPYSIV